MRPVTHGELFAGISGAGLGFAASGIETLWCVEIDPHCQRVLRKHHPDALVLGDIQRVTALNHRGGRNGSSLDGQERGGAEDANVSEAVAVGAEENTVVQGERPAHAFGDDVVGIAGSLMPPAPHTDIGKATLQGSLPSTLVGVNRPLGDDIVPPDVPRNGLVSRLRGAGDTDSVPMNEPPESPATVTLGAQVITTTGTNNHITHGINYTTTSPKAHLPAVDVISAGFPCQDVSVAGKRAGLAGERTGLFWEIIRIVKEMREATNGDFPRLVLLENVPGLLSSNGGRDFGVVLNALADSGAVDIAWRVVDAQHWVPQRRRRVFIVACYPSFSEGRAGIGRAAEILFESESLRGYPAAGGEAGKGIAGGVAPSLRGSGPGVARAGDSRGQDPVIVDTARALTSHPDDQDGTVDTYVYKKRGGFGWSEANGVSPTLESEGGSHQGGPERVPMVFHENIGGNMATAATARSRRSGASKSYQGVVTAFMERGRAEGRNLEQQTDLAYALDNPGVGGRTDHRQVQYGSTVRRLTPVECCRLQGFPDDHLDGLGLSDSHKYRMLGNAINVAVSRWLGKALLAALRAG